MSKLQRQLEASILKQVKQRCEQIAKKMTESSNTASVYSDDRNTKYVFAKDGANISIQSVSSNANNNDQIHNFENNNIYYNNSLYKN